MQLGFVSAILPDLSLEEVLAFAADEGFACVELMCWPPGGADRRYAGVTHLDVTQLHRRRRPAASATWCRSTASPSPASATTPTRSTPTRSIAASSSSI